MVKNNPRLKWRVTAFPKCTWMAVTLFLATKAVSESAPSDLKCALGWGSGSSEETRTIPADWIDDGYCDCPLEGLDEPTTGACSGSAVGGWAGVHQSNTEIDSAYFYECPFESSLILPPSKINDGICDCCDGSDEKLPSSACPDKCEALRKAYQAEQDKIKLSYKNGSIQRAEEIAKYGAFIEKTKNDLSLLEHNKMSSVEQVIEMTEKRLRNEQKKYIFDRRTLLSNLSHELILAEDNENSIGFLEALKAEEIINLIMGICQLNAEHPDFDSDVTECEALTKAGLELGIAKKNGFLQKVAQEPDDVDDEIEFFVEQIIHDILQLESTSDANTKSTSSKKKIRKHDLDDDDYDDYDDTFRDANQQMETESPVSQFDDSIVSRSNFKESASNLLDQISSILDDDESNEESNKSDQTQLDSIDQISLQKVKSSLETKIKQIEIGEQIASSATTQLDEIIELVKISEYDLMIIASAVIFHSSITAADVVELLYLVVPDLQLKEGVGTCVSTVCRPDLTIIERYSFDSANPKIIQLPPSSLLMSYDERCQQRSGFDEHLSVACEFSSESMSNFEIPNEIFDGYMNFFSFVKRTESDSDPFTALFQPLREITKNVSFSSDMTLLSTTQAKLDEYKREQKELQLILSGDNDKYGPSGELYTLRDTCHSVIAAKYEYEICFFGKSYQREATSGSKSGGTSLGKWNNYRIEEDGTIVLNFIGGQKCWNGPSRSATVHVTCGGRGTKLLSVEEPDTCRYVMEMESYIACDEKFAKF